MSASGPPSDDLSPAEVRTGADPVASGKSPNPDGVGGRQRHRAGGARAPARGCPGSRGSRALLVEGEPGIGKTTLLEAARSLADGFTRLSTQGVEPESVLAHAGLLELVTPVRHLLEEVPAPRPRRWVRRSVGRAPEAPADPFLVAAATLSLLAAAAESAPVLVTVDDLQWLDRESAAAILFAARRLGPDAVAFVFTARTGAVPQDLLRGIPVLPSAGSSAAAASRLVPAPRRTPSSQRLVADTEGNPAGAAGGRRSGSTGAVGRRRAAARTRCRSATGCSATTRRC